MKDSSLEENGKYLPIGTVVLFKGCLRPIMIIGVYVMNPFLKTSDYLGVIYPEGYIDNNTIMCFNHSDILMILKMGFKNRYYKRFNEKLIEMSDLNEID